MRAIFTVEVPDDFLARRAREYDNEAGECAVVTDPAEIFRIRAEEVAGDELPFAFFGWPAEVTIAVQP